MTNDPILALDAVRACVTAAEGRVADALNLLAGRTDPDSVRARLTILLDQKRDEEACSLAASLPLHADWSVKAVQATFRAGSIEAGKRLLSEIDERFAADGLLRWRARLVAAQTLYQNAIGDVDDQNLLFPVSLDATGRGLVNTAAALLTPVIDRVHGFGHIELPVEMHIVELAFQLAFLSGDRETSLRIGTVLERVRPIPMAYVAGVLRRQFPHSPDLLSRLRTEHENSWEAKLAAIRVESYVLERPERAALSALALIPSIPAEFRDDLGKIIFDLTERLPRDTAADIEQVLPEIVPAESAVLVAFKVRQALRSGNLQLAETLIAEVANKDEPIALQFQAHLLLAQGKKHEARTVLESACARFPTPTLFELAADLAAEEADWDVAAKLLASVLLLVPSDASLRNKRSQVLIEAGRFAEAAAEFDQLAKLEPEKKSHRFNRAAAYAQAGLLDESLRAFEDFCETADAPLEGILGRVQILTALGRAMEGFALLQETEARFWDSREFVALYMSSGYSSGHDSEAHRAMMRLQELEQRIEPSQRMLRAFSLEDLKGHFTHFQKSDDLLQEQLLRGEVPWLFVDELLNRVPYAAWAARTQSLLWESDDPLIAARFSVYSSNGFHTVVQNESRELCELTCPGRSTRICIDMSALITLQELGLLETAADYFGSIVVPAQFFEAGLEHLRSLVPHQPSRRASAVALRSLMESGRINVRDDDRDHRTPARLMEYDDSGAPTYRLVDLADALRSAGGISDAEHTNFLKVAHAPSGIGEGNPALRPGQPILCDDSTLDVIFQQGLLDAVVDTFDIYISAADRKSLLGVVAAFDAQSDLYRRAESLMRAVRADRRFELKHVVLPEDFKDEEFVGDAMRVSTFAAAFGAVSHGIPLFADDRALQMFVHHRSNASSSQAFGTGALINRLAEEENADLPDLGRAMLALLQWRYHFVVPSAGLLKYLAGEFVGHLPGRFLKTVANYAHQSMRDPGLFGGFEPTTPPTSIAARLYLLWIKAFMELLAQCWMDKAYSVDQANRVTDWIFREALPPPPRRLDANVQRLLAEQTALSCINYFGLALVSCDQPDRIREAMRAVQKGLGIGDDRYLQLVTKIAHEH